MRKNNIKDNSIELIKAARLAGLSINAIQELNSEITGKRIGKNAVKNLLNEAWQQGLDEHSIELINNYVEFKKNKRKPVHRQALLAPYFHIILEAVDNSPSFAEATKKVNQKLAKEGIVPLSYWSVRRLAIKAKGYE